MSFTSVGGNRSESSMETIRHVGWSCRGPQGQRGSPHYLCHWPGLGAAVSPNQTGWTITGQTKIEISWQIIKKDQLSRKKRNQMAKGWKALTWGGSGWDPCLNFRLVISGTDLDICTVEAAKLQNTWTTYAIIPKGETRTHKLHATLVQKVKLGNSNRIYH